MWKKISARQKKIEKSLKRNLKTLLCIAALSLAIAVFAHVVGEMAVFSQKDYIDQDDTSQQGDVLKNDTEEYQILAAEDGACGRPEIIQDFIEENPYSRSGISLDVVNGIVIHYVGNAGTTAQENRDYFENLKDTHITKASSHFIIGLDGEIIQCIPLDEIAYASNDRNSDTISIECCHKKENGKFNKKTYASLVQLTAWLCDTYGLSSDDVIRHYDVTGKLCPLYYVEHPDAWEDFLETVEDRLS